MKLYLSSYFFGKHPEKLASLVGANKKVGIIMNAADIFGNAKRPDYLANEVDKFRGLGLEAEELDLRDYFDNNSPLQNKLHGYGLLWVMGGNSFVLRRAMRYSGFDQYIGDLVHNEQLVYAGFSAGSVVATKTLRGIELVDDPKEIPEGFREETIWEGLGFIDFSIAPHYKSDHPESESINRTVEYFIDHNLPFVALRDGEAILIENNPSNYSILS